jgi:hypothetical protein
MVTIRHRFGSHASKGQDDSSTARLLDRPRQTSTRGLRLGSSTHLALYLELSRVRAPLLQRYCTLALQRFKVKVDGPPLIGPPQVNYTQLGGWMMDMFWWTFRFDLNCTH